MKKNFLEIAGSVLLILMGNALYALTIQMFFLKSGIIIGGTTGIALCVNHYWGIPMPPFILAFNTLMLLLGLIFFGKKFVLTTIISRVSEVSGRGFSLKKQYQ